MDTSRWTKLLEISRRTFPGSCSELEKNEKSRSVGDRFHLSTICVLVRFGYFFEKFPCNKIIDSKVRNEISGFYLTNTYFGNDIHTSSVEHILSRSRFFAESRVCCFIIKQSTRAQLN